MNGIKKMMRKNSLNLVNIFKIPLSLKFNIVNFNITENNFHIRLTDFSNLKKQVNLFKKRMIWVNRYLYKKFNLQLFKLFYFRNCIRL